MMHSHKHQEPSFQSFRSAVSPRSSQKSSDLTIHALHHIRGRRQVQCGIRKIRAVLIQPPQDFTEPIPIGLGTQRMDDVSAHTRRQSSGDYRISRCDDFLHRLIRSSSSVSPSDTPLDAPQEDMQAGYKVEVASLQDPSVIGRDAFNSPNTVGNQAYNAPPGILGHIADTPSPSFRRFPFLTQDRTQENGIFSVHAPHSHQVRHPSRIPKPEPQRINNQKQRARRDTRRPWRAIQRHEYCGVPLTQSGNRPVSAARSARQRLLAPHGTRNISQPPLPGLSSSPFLPDRPSYSAYEAAFPTLTMSMNNRVRTPDFSVSCFHTRRIPNKNKQTSTIFPA